METTGGRFREAIEAMEPKLREVRRSFSGGRNLLKKVLRLAKGSLRDIADGNTGAVRDVKAEIFEAVNEMGKMPSGWLRAQLMERGASVYVRLVFVEVHLPYVVDGGELPSVESFSSERLKVSDQAWLWGVVGGPTELYDVLRMVRMGGGITFQDHIAYLQRFLEAARSVAEDLVAEVFDKYPADVLSISGDRRNSLGEELKKLRVFIRSRESELVDLLSQSAPDGSAST